MTTPRIASITVATRARMRGLCERAGAAHVLHLLDVPDEVCKARLRARNAACDHPFETSNAEFDQISRHFVAPTADEGFTVVRHR